MAGQHTETPAVYYVVQSFPDEDLDKEALQAWLKNKFETGMPLWDENLRVEHKYQRYVFKVPRSSSRGLLTNSERREIINLKTPPTPPDYRNHMRPGYGARIDDENSEDDEDFEDDDDKYEGSKHKYYGIDRYGNHYGQ